MSVSDELSSEVAVALLEMEGAVNARLERRVGPLPLDLKRALLGGQGAPPLKAYLRTIARHNPERNAGRELSTSRS
jgi:hypothetical protein